MVKNVRKNPLSVLGLSFTWREIKDRLTPENEKRFLRAAAHLSKLFLRITLFFIFHGQHILFFF